MGSKNKNSNTPTQEFPYPAEEVASEPAAVETTVEASTTGEHLTTKTVPETADERVSRYVRESASTQSNTEDIVLYAGLVGETGEAVDYCKKCLAHGTAYDRANLVREIGDICWYVAAIQRKHGRKNVGIEILRMVANLDQSIVGLAKQTAATDPDFMTHGHAIAVTDRLNYILGYAVNLLGEMDIRFAGRAETTSRLFDADLFEVLDENKRKLDARYPQGVFTEKDANAKADVQ